MEKELDKAYAAQTLMEQTIRNIESAQSDVNVYEAMKQGDKVIEELQKQVTTEQFEELLERHQEQQARKDMEAEMFGQVLNEGELQDELDQLDAMILEEQLPSAAEGYVEPVARVGQKEENKKEQMASSG